MSKFYVEYIACLKLVHTYTWLMMSTHNFFISVFLFITEGGTHITESFNSVPWHSAAKVKLQRIEFLWIFDYLLKIYSSFLVNLKIHSWLALVLITMNGPYDGHRIYIMGPHACRLFSAFYTFTQFSVHKISEGPLKKITEGHITQPIFFLNNNTTQICYSIGVTIRVDQKKNTIRENMLLRMTQKFNWVEYMLVRPRLSTNM